jgi:hypothetical protein
MGLPSQQQTLEREVMSNRVKLVLGLCSFVVSATIVTIVRRRKSNV